jgi:serine/threonine-protein kinase
VTQKQTRNLLLLVLLFLVAACNGNQAPTDVSNAAPTDVSSAAPTEADTAPPPTPGGTFLTYEHEDYGFLLEYPDDWEIVEKAEAQIVIFVSPEGESGSFRENVSVLTQDLESEAVTLEEYTNLSLSQAEGFVPDYMLLESVPVTVAGNPGYNIVYIGTQGVYDILWFQVWTLVGDRAFVVTYTAERESYEQHLPTAERMIDSLELP